MTAVILLTVICIVVDPPVSFPTIVIVAVLSVNNRFAVISKLNPATATLCASSLSPINLGNVGILVVVCNASFGCILRTLESERIAVYPNELFAFAILYLIFRFIPFT